MIGIDLIEVERIKQSLKKENFINKILTKTEKEYVNSFVDKEAHIAGFFACKEAVMKALEDCKKISFLEIEVQHSNLGKPSVVLSGKAKEVYDKGEYKNIEVSISQTKTYATAICVIS